MDALLEKQDARMRKMDMRAQKLDGRHRADFMWLLTLGIGGTALILATMAYGFH
jgi:hypothetical protein